MAFERGILSCIFNKNKNNNINDDDGNYKSRCSDQERNFLENGSMILEDLIAFSNGKYNTSIRRFSIQELSQATNGFCSHQIVVEHHFFKIYKGSFDKRLILIKKHDNLDGSLHTRATAIRDMVITSLMSSHKNVSKLIGCCLDLDFPASVYECPAAGGSIELLSKRLFESEGGMVENGGSSSFTWKNRLKIANDIAYAVVYMHIAFATPIIHRDLKPTHIIIDQSGVAKLLDFSFSIAIPPGETQVKDIVTGTFGYLDPEMFSTGFTTEKSDVYSFGRILLALLTGKRNVDRSRDNPNLLAWVQDFVEKDQFNEIVDPRILKERGGIEQEQQLQAVLALALRCTQYNKEDRPEMIDVAKELRRMLKSDCPSSSTQP